MNVQSFLTDLGERGISLTAHGGRIHYQGHLSDQDRTLIHAHKAALLKALGQSPKPLPPRPEDLHPFDQVHLAAIHAGQAVDVWSGILETWLYWVKDEDAKARLVERGIAKGAIYTLGELAVVIGIPPEDLKNLHAIKRRFGGTLQGTARACLEASAETGADTEGTES